MSCRTLFGYEGSHEQREERFSILELAADFACVKYLIYPFYFESFAVKSLFLYAPILRRIDACPKYSVLNLPFKQTVSLPPSLLAMHNPNHSPLCPNVYI